MSTDVAAHAAENPVFGVEQHGIDYIPEDQRKMTLRQLADFWIGVSLYPFNFVIGPLAYSLGLPLWQTLLIIAAGTILGYLAVGYGGIAGPRSGVPTHIVGRAAFGVRFNSVNSLMAWLVGIVYEIVNVATGTFAALALFDQIGWKDSGDAGKVLGIVLVYLTSVIVSFLGHGTLIYVQRFFAAFLGIATVLVLLFLLPNLDLSAGLGHPDLTWFAAAAIAMGIVIAGSGTYVIDAADFSRYLPKDTAGSKIAGVQAWAASGATLLLAFTGAIAASQTKADVIADPFTTMKPLVDQPIIYVLFLLAAIGGAISNNALTLYSAALAAQAVGLPLKRAQAVLVDAAIATVGIAVVIFGSGSYLANLNNLVVFAVVWAFPYGAIWIYDAFKRNWHIDPVAAHGGSESPYYGSGGAKPGAVIALLAGVLMAFLSINVPKYHGPISDAFDGADLSWFVGPLVAIVLYVILRPIMDRDTGVLADTKTPAGAVAK